MTWQTSISREELAGLPIRRYEGVVRLVESAQALADEAAAIRRESVLGFDTETRPAFRKGESYPPSLVQLAGEAVVWIFPRSEEHTSELQSRGLISYAAFCLKKKKEHT